MSSIVSEFSRLVPLLRLGSPSLRQRIEATKAEREKLALRFDLLTLEQLVADVELRRQSGGGVLLEATFEAEFEQCCAITLDPVRGALSDRFSLVYGPIKEEEREVTLSEIEPAFEPLTGDAIDIGEAVAQELSLALPEFPRQPDATIDDFAPREALEGPFASLANLGKSGEC